MDTEIEIGGAQAVSPEVRRPSMASLIVRNVAVVGLTIGGWYAIDTGYFTPDRPTRDQWERLTVAKDKPVDPPVYQADFTKVGRGDAPPADGWSRFNGALPSTTVFDANGVTINYKDAAWLGAEYRFEGYIAGRIYRVTFDAEVENQPGAFIVRNRQMDLTREPIPVGKSTHAFHFLAPQGTRDKVRVIFIPDRPSNPEGKMVISTLKLEPVKE